MRFIKTFSFLITGVLVGFWGVTPLFSQDNPVLYRIRPQEVELAPGEQAHFDVVRLEENGQLAPAEVVEWQVVPADLGHINRQGYFQAGRDQGDGLVRALVRIGQRPQDRQPVEAKVHVRPRGGIVTGRVVSRDDRPLALARLSLSRIDGGPHSAMILETHTNEEGFFAFHGVPFGHYTIRATAPGFFPDPPEGERRRVVLDRNHLHQEVGFRLSPKNSVSGTVMVPDNGVIQRGWVTAIPLAFANDSARPLPHRSSRVREDGTYTIWGLLPGAYALRADVAGYAPQFYDGSTDLADVTSVQMPETGDVTGIDFTLSLGLVIRGGVTQASDSTILAGVRLFARLKEADLTRTGVSDEQGNYQITGLIPGTYTVSALARGFRPQFYNGAATPQEADPVVVDEANQPVGIDFQLEPSGSISGMVSDAQTDLPLPGARIAVRSTTANLERHQVTDEDGTYLVTDLPDGGYTVHAWMPGFLGLFYDGAMTETEAREVVVTAGAPAGQINFALPHLPTIAGTIFALSDRTPLEGVRVYVMPVVLEPDSLLTDAHSGPFHQRPGDRTSPGDDLFRPAVTDSNGNYETQGLLPGSYLVYAEGPGYGRKYYANVDNSHDATLVELTGQSGATGIDFELALLGAIQGRIHLEDGTTPERARVVAFRQGRFDWVREGVLLSEDPGAYEISDLASGDYLVFAAAPGHLPRFYPDAAHRKDAQPVSVSEGTVTAGIDFVLPRGASVSGRVTVAASHQPAVGIKVFIRRLGRPFADHTTTDPQGHYLFGGLTAGHYEIIVPEMRPLVRPDEEGETANARRIHLAAGEQRTGVNFNVLAPDQHPGRIWGVVRSQETHEPLEGALVILHQANGPPRVAVTDEEGRFQHRNLPPGSYYLLATAPRYVAQYFGGVSDWRRAIRLHLDENHRELPASFALRLAPEGVYRLHGTILSRDNQPLADAVVFAEAEDGSRASTLTDDDGRFLFESLPPGRFRISAGRVRYQHTHLSQGPGGEPQIVELTDETTIPEISLTLDGTDFEPDLGGAQVTLADLQGHAGDSLFLPITVDDVTDMGITAFEFDLVFDEELLDAGTLITSGTLSEGYVLTANASDGRLSVAAAGLQPLSGSGTLILVGFTIDTNASQGQQSVIQVERFIFNEGNVPLREVTAGSIGLAGTRFGDISGNGAVSAFDASLVLQRVAGLLEGFTAEQATAADVTGNGQITAFDAAFIMRFVVGKIGRFPVESGTTTKILVRRMPDLQIVEPVVVSSPEAIAVPLTLAGIRGAHAFRAVYTYNPEQLVFLDAEVEAATKEGQLVVGQKEGKIILAWAGPNPLPARADLVTLRFTLAEAAHQGGTLILNQVQVDEESPLNPKLEIALNRALPTSYALQQNYPNPFNPQTTIRYQLPRADRVTLRVYNLLGQEIRTLLDARQQAGYHQIVWDGRDKQGQQVASGVYFYRISAGPFTTIRRMVLLR